VSVLSPYPGEDARERELEALCAQAGGELLQVGTSVEARTIRAARVPSTNTAPDTPSVLVNANIHGPEWIASRVAMGVLRALAEDREDARALRAAAHVVVVPCINVDGFARTERLGGQGTLKTLRTNAHGVDLNRNFPIPARAGNAGSIWAVFNPHFLTMGGSDDPARATYRGPEALSEPEARAMDGLAQKHAFRACVSLHSFMGTLIPPCVRSAEEARTYRRLCQAFQRAQPRTRYRRLAGRAFDVLTGELEDRLHHDFGCWALTVECFTVWRSIAQHLIAPSLFWRFNPHDPEPTVANDVAGIFAFLRAALDTPHPHRVESAARGGSVLPSDS
jgi:predicted deacylase